MLTRPATRLLLTCCVLACGAGHGPSTARAPIGWALQSCRASRQAITALLVCGVEIKNAKISPSSRALDGVDWGAPFPYSERDLTPLDAGSDEFFYVLPRFVNHAGDEARAELADFHSAVLPNSGEGAVLDLCSSFTSHYPKGYRAQRCVALGLNPLELLANPSKTEFRVQNLNTNPSLSDDDGTFDVVTLSLSVDYMTKPLQLFAEIHRVLKPGGIATMAFTNRCFQGKVVRRFLRSPGLCARCVTVESPSNNNT